ncbi:MAG: hypothetical protein PHE24_05785 [Patescibacteria group bacterium]|nr:hypothetical protein [Patescibacteria group bacterium]
MFDVETKKSRKIRNGDTIMFIEKEGILLALDKNRVEINWTAMETKNGKYDIAFLNKNGEKGFEELAYVLSLALNLRAEKNTSYQYPAFTFRKKFRKK